MAGPSPTAAGTCPGSREVVILRRQRSASTSSGHIHGPVLIGYPTRNIPRLIEDVGDHRRRPREPGEPVAMQLDPPKPIPSQLRIGSWVCQPGRRIGPDPRQRSVLRLNQPPGGIRPRGPLRRSPKIAPDHAQILLPGGVRDQDNQRCSCRLRAFPIRGASAGFLTRLKHTPCLALRGTGIANTQHFSLCPAAGAPDARWGHRSGVAAGSVASH
jgi:hypothetical protein